MKKNQLNSKKHRGITIFILKLTNRAMFLRHFNGVFLREKIHEKVL